MNNNPIQPTTPIHTHTVPPLELQAVGGAMRLGRKNDGLDAMREEVKETTPAYSAEEKLKNRWVDLRAR
jgi:hypothetical protein